MNNVKFVVMFTYYSTHSPDENGETTLDAMIMDG